MKKRYFIVWFVLLIAFSVNNLAMSPSPLLSNLSKKNQTSNVLFEEFSINTIIYETLAEINYTGLFFNPTNTTTTANFTIEIPEESYVSNISLQKDNIIYWGRIMKKQEAQEAFENATEANRSAVLLTTLGRYRFRVDFSIEPESRIETTLTYYKRITRFKGHYDLYMDLESILLQDPQSFGANFTIISPLRSIGNVVIPDGTQFIKKSFHLVKMILPQTSLSTGSIGLSYDLTGAALGNNILAYNNGTNEFFLTTFSPSLSELGTDGLPKDFVFIIDVSGSMGGQKIDQAKTALLNIIDKLHMEDRLGVVKFSSSATTAQSQLIKRSDSNGVSTIKSWVANLEAGGSTNIYDALILGLGLFNSLERPAILVLLTDGRANTGLSNTADIKDEFHRTNTGDVSLFTLGFGNDVDFPFLRRLARQNAGEAVKIEENLNATEQITSFYESVSTPLLTNIRLTCNSGVVSNTIYPYFIPNLFDGSELFFVGERIANSPIELNITGHSSEGELFYIIKLTTPSSTNKEDSWIEKIWVIAKIDDLITRIGYGDDIENNTETVTSMALFYGILTPYTAMFIDTEASEEEEISEEEPHDSFATTTNTYKGHTVPPTVVQTTMAAEATHTTKTTTTEKESPSEAAFESSSSREQSKEPTDTEVTSSSPGFVWMLIVIVIPSTIVIRRFRKE